MCVELGLSRRPQIRSACGGMNSTVLITRLRWICDLISGGRPAPGYWLCKTIDSGERAMRKTPKVPRLIVMTPGTPVERVQRRQVQPDVMRPVEHGHFDHERLARAQTRDWPDERRTTNPADDRHGASSPHDTGTVGPLRATRGRRPRRRRITVATDHAPTRRWPPRASV